MRFFVLIAGLLIAGCQTTAPDVVDANKWPTPTTLGVSLPTPPNPLKDVQGLAGPVPGIDRLDDLTNQFDVIIFNLEDQGEDPYIQKWNTPIQFWNYSRLMIGGDIARTTKKLTAITGIEFTKLPRGKDGANLSIITASHSDRGDGHCFAQSSASIEDRATLRAHVFIGSDFRQEFLGRCVEEELSQIMGPRNDATVIEDSLWRPYGQQGYDSLTWPDAVILRALYDQRLKPGMHKDKAMPIVRTIIGELLTELNQ